MDHRTPEPHRGAPRVTLLYHFFHPDDVISARLYSELAAELAACGWDVVARPSNRRCHETTSPLSRQERWRGVTIRRIRRPNLSQGRAAGRLINSGWMVAAWSWAALTAPRRGREVVLIGTDPVMGVTAAVAWKLFRRQTKVAHWCFDLYPEAAVADGTLRESSWITRLMRRLARMAYRRCDFVADIGPCMAARLEDQLPVGGSETITPWSLVEPADPPEPDPQVRAELFGDSRLGLLYSGSFGRAHSYQEFLELARLLRTDRVGFCFAGRGNRADELRAAVDEGDANISFAGFAPEHELEQRLTACDLHLVSLTPEWTGTVVPSKFFGALASGRGVLFAGSEDSAIAQWTREHKVGWVLTPATVQGVAAELRDLAAHPERLATLRRHCHAVYQRHFSRERMVERWDTELRRLLSGE